MLILARTHVHAHSQCCTVNHQNDNHDLGSHQPRNMCFFGVCVCVCVSVCVIFVRFRWSSGLISTIVFSTSRKWWKTHKNMENNKWWRDVEVKKEKKIRKWLRKEKFAKKEIHTFYLKIALKFYNSIILCVCFQYCIPLNNLGLKHDFFFILLS